MVELYYKDIG